MRDLFINYSISKIRKQYEDYDDDKIAEIKYGLEGLYILITKTIVIFTIAAIVGVVKELFILLIFFNILRLTGFGLHAKSSSKCLISSSLVFIGIAMMCKWLIVPFPIRLILSSLCVVNFIMYAPADTEKRPLINTKKRYVYKILTVMVSVIYTILQFLINDNFIANVITFAMIIEGTLIHPLIYRIFKFRYANYKYY